MTSRLRSQYSYILVCDSTTGWCEAYPGRVGRPGIIIMSPTRGYRKPAPTDALTSLMGSTKPEGAPFADASALKEYWVLAMQIGKPSKPILVYRSICFSAWGRYSTLAAPYTSLAMDSIFACTVRNTSTYLHCSCLRGDPRSSIAECGRT